MHPAENVPERVPVYFSALIKEFSKKGYSFTEFTEEEACTLILRSDNKQSDGNLQPTRQLGITPE